MAGFEVDVAGLQKFVTTARGIAEQVGSLRQAADAAKLAPGTFTQLPAGRRIDGVHAVMLRGIENALDTAVERISHGADTALSTADAYHSTDSAAGGDIENAGRGTNQDNGSRT